MRQMGDHLDGLYKLPEGWQRVRLGEVCDYKSGVWAQADPEGIPVLRSTDFLPDGSLSYGTAIRLALNEKQLRKSILQPGDILLEDPAEDQTNRSVELPIFRGKEHTALVTSLHVYVFHV